MQTGRLSVKDARAIELASKISESPSIAQTSIYWQRALAWGLCAEVRSLIDAQKRAAQVEEPACARCGGALIPGLNTAYCSAKCEDLAEVAS